MTAATGSGVAGWLRGLLGPAPIQTESGAAPLWVELGPLQEHPIDLRWADELMTSIRPHVMVRPEDELLILVPNSPTKMNGTAMRILRAMVDHGADVEQVLRTEGDSPRKRRELHYFFTDLKDLLSGHLGDGTGRRAVTQEPFTAVGFCDYPVLSEIALTYRCNLSCSFCYAGCSVGGLPAGWSEERTMSDDEVIRVLEKIRWEGRCPSVSFTGGEPTVRPALPRFVRHAKQALGMKVNLISNGQLLDQERTRALADAGLDSAQLSLEGHEPALHDALVGRPGAFDRLWGAVERLSAHGIRVHTNTTLNQRNAAHAAEIVDLVADRGLSRLTMNLMIPCGTASGGPSDLFLSYSEVGDRILALRKQAGARGVQLIWYSPIPMCLFNTVSHGLGNSGCAAADGLLHVNPAGDVLPCSSFDHSESLGNLLRQPFEELWQSAPSRHFRNKQMLPASCSGCPERAICQGACPLYWREVGLNELGGPASRHPPLPTGFHGPRCRSRCT